MSPSRDGQPSLLFIIKDSGPYAQGSAAVMQTSGCAASAWAAPVTPTGHLGNEELAGHELMLLPAP